MNNGKSDEKPKALKHTDSSAQHKIKALKQKATFTQDFVLPIDQAPSKVMNLELHRKIESFYKVKARKHSVNKPIDASESFLASGGPSTLLVAERNLKRLEFLQRPEKLRNQFISQITSARDQKSKQTHLDSFM